MKKKFYYNIGYKIALGKCFSVGTVTGPKKAKIKSTVTLELAVDPGYKLTFLKVTGTNKQDVETTILNVTPESSEIVAGTQTYTFEMPNFDVIVSADFEQIIDGYYKGHPFVTIDGVSWATCNLGADSPEKIGQQFAWADTDVNLKRWPYTYNNLPYCYASNQRQYSSNVFRKKYGSWSNELEDADDASCKIGTNYQTPTYQHIEELIKNTTSSYDSESKILTLTSKTDTTKTIQFYGDVKYLSRSQKNTSDKLVTNTTAVVFYINGDELYAKNLRITDPYRVRPIYKGTTVPDNYVDLGLPSGVKWSLYDLNGFDESGAVKMATSIEEGEGYCWGDTEPFINSELQPTVLSRYGFTKYDNKYQLVSEDDAATVNLGNAWRTPTKSEFTELYSLKWELTSLNEISGYKFTASNGNSIFFPCAGQKNGTSEEVINSHCRYWCSDGGGIHSDEVGPRANLFYPSSDKFTSWFIYYGFPVRAVSDTAEESVDLGLSVRWATCNVGASQPEEYGNYYAWGETTPKNDYSWDTYKYLSDGSTVLFTTRYADTNSNKELLVEDDAATINWGEGWRVPNTACFNQLLNKCTYQRKFEYQCKRQASNYPAVRTPLISEWQELINNCTFTDATSDPSKPVTKATSKINGNCILLPRAGYKGGTNKETGYYWPKDLTESDFTQVKSIRVSSDNCSFASETRQCCYTIRGVSKTMDQGGPRDSRAKYIDLGLPSGTYWVDRNVGAETPEDSGFYYAWASVIPYPDSSGVYFSNGKLTKYCKNPDQGCNGFIDGLTVLDGFDDAATYYYGQFKYQDSFGDAVGLEFISKKEDPTKSRILYFPYAGEMTGDAMLDEGGALNIMARNEFDCGKQTYAVLKSWPKASSPTPEMKTLPRPYGSNIRPVILLTVTITTDGNGTASYTGTLDEGNEITITATPNADYILGEITASKSDGTTIEVTDGKFIMPLDCVKVLVTFVEHVLHTISISATNGTVTGPGVAYFNDEVTLTITPDSGYEFDTLKVMCGKEEIAVTDDGKFTMPNGDVEITATFKAKAVGPGFSVSATERVYFAPGNLQYQASTNIWRFAEEQYDYIGDDNINISDTYEGWIDLFGWGTANNPTNTSTNNSNYSTFTDWGTNEIDGYAANTWRTLTKDEWEYIIKTRTNASSLFGFATVNGTKGLILLPDSWALPSGLTFKSGIAAFTNNEYTTAQWQQMESNGAVFLPAAGYRFGTTVSDVQSSGCYWSSTPRGTLDAYYLYFNDSNLYPRSSGYRCDGHSVRLVRKVVYYNITIAATTNGAVVADKTAAAAGETITLTATPETGYEVENITVKDADNNDVTLSADYTFTMPESAVTVTATFKEQTTTPIVSAAFTVAEGKQVYFSQGNLQYTQSTKTWAFAENQYDMLGTDNVTGGEVSSDATEGDSKSGTALADKIDLFGWSANNTTAPWGISTSTDYENNYSGDFVDWGKNIGNGNTWRTLTNAEWRYILNTRANASDKKGVARIKLSETEYVNGLILLPDSWTCPSGVIFTNGLSSVYSVQAYADYQTFTLADWQKLEAAGALFLPAAGYRYGTGVYYVQSDGLYWSSTVYDTNHVYNLNFNSNEAGTSCSNRIFGLAVRLVQDVGTI